MSSKALLEALPPSENESFLTRRFGLEGFTAPFHFHPEYEITYILEGSGKRYVGSNMNGFDKDDLVMIGANLPHCWKLSENDNTDASSVVIKFRKDFVGEEFFSVPEMSTILSLLDKSTGGIHFKGKGVLSVKEKMLTLSKERNRLKSFLLLLEILELLSGIKSKKTLNNKQSLKVHENPDSKKVNKVFAYIVDNFQEEVTLAEAAATIIMTTNAFCKYFKKVTRKTFMETVIDYRINYATQQLTETEKSISDICYESGFNDISHFYKTFVSRMDISPLNYRKQFSAV